MHRPFPHPTKSQQSKSFQRRPGISKIIGCWPPEVPILWPENKNTCAAFQKQHNLPTVLGCPPCRKLPCPSRSLHSSSHCPALVATELQSAKFQIEHGTDFDKLVYIGLRITFNIFNYIMIRPKFMDHVNHVNHVNHCPQNKLLHKCAVTQNVKWGPGLNRCGVKNHCRLCCLDAHLVNRSMVKQQDCPAPSEAPHPWTFSDWSHDNRIHNSNTTSGKFRTTTLGRK